MNADEMEPGAFKDRLLLEGDPHQAIEGLLIAAYALEATTAYIFLRREYARAEKLLRNAIAEARKPAVSANMFSVLSMEHHGPPPCQCRTVYVRGGDRITQCA